MEYVITTQSGCRQIAQIVNGTTELHEKIGQILCDEAVELIIIDRRKTVIDYTKGRKK